MKDAEAVPVLASTPTFLSGHVSPLDVEYLDQVAGDNWRGDSAVYAFYSGLFQISHLIWILVLHWKPFFQE